MNFESAGQGLAGLCSLRSRVSSLARSWFNFSSLSFRSSLFSNLGKSRRIVEQPASALASTLMGCIWLSSRQFGFHDLAKGGTQLQVNTEESIAGAKFTTASLYSFDTGRG